MREVANRTLVGILLALVAVWVTAILSGALKQATTDMGPSPAGCHSCVVHWR